MRDPLRMQAVQPPIIPIVGELVRSCPGTISLGQGEDSYGPPPEVIDQLARFLADPANHNYKPVQGRPMLLDLWAASLGGEGERAIRAEVDLAALLAYRTEFPALQDMRHGGDGTAQ